MIVMIVRSGAYMKLLYVIISGYRRFVKANTVRLSEPLIAIVGPNEAGKSSFLSALLQLDNDNPIPDRDQTRRATHPPQISGAYELDQSDQNALDEVQPGLQIKKCTLRKKKDGKFEVGLDPTPAHDLVPRRNIIKELTSVPASVFAGNKKRQEEIKKLIGAVLKQLNNEKDYLGPPVIQSIKELSTQFKNIFAPQPSINQAIVMSKEVADEARRFSGLLDELAKHEENSLPQKVRNVLLRRRPKIIFFEPEARNLLKESMI